MDTSDFYDTAVLALEAIEESTAPFTDKRLDAIRQLQSFIRAADRERAANNTRSAYRAHIKEGEIT